MIKNRIVFAPNVKKTHYSEINKAHISCRFAQRNIHSLFQHPTMCNNISTRMKNSATSHNISQA